MVDGLFEIAVKRHVSVLAYSNVVLIDQVQKPLLVLFGLFPLRPLHFLDAIPNAPYSLLDNRGKWGKIGKFSAVSEMVGKAHVSRTEE